MHGLQLLHAVNLHGTLVQRQLFHICLLQQREHKQLAVFVRINQYAQHLWKTKGCKKEGGKWQVGKKQEDNCKETMLPSGTDKIKTARAGVKLRL